MEAGNGLALQQPGTTCNGGFRALHGRVAARCTPWPGRGAVVAARCTPWPGRGAVVAARMQARQDPVRALAHVRPHGV